LVLFLYFRWSTQRFLSLARGFFFCCFLPPHCAPTLHFSFSPLSNKVRLFLGRIVAVVFALSCFLRQLPGKSSAFFPKIFFRGLSVRIFFLVLSPLLLSLDKLVLSSYVVEPFPSLHCLLLHPRRKVRSLTTFFSSPKKVGLGRCKLLCRI